MRRLVLESSCHHLRCARIIKETETYNKAGHWRPPMPCMHSRCKKRSGPSFGHRNLPSPRPSRVGYFLSFATAITATTSDANAIISVSASAIVTISTTPFHSGSGHCPPCIWLCMFHYTIKSGKYEYTFVSSMQIRNVSLPEPPVLPRWPLLRLLSSSDHRLKTPLFSSGARKGR